MAAASARSKGTRTPRASGVHLLSERDETRFGPSPPMRPPTVERVLVVAQVECVAALEGGLIVSGSKHWTLMIWSASHGRRLSTLEGHRGPARLLRPSSLRESDETLFGRSPPTRPPTVERVLVVAQVWCVAALEGGLIVSGSKDNTLMIWNAALPLGL